MINSIKLFFLEKEMIEKAKRVSLEEVETITPEEIRNRSRKRNE